VYDLPKARSHVYYSKLPISREREATRRLLDTEATSRLNPIEIDGVIDSGYIEKLIEDTLRTHRSYPSQSHLGLA